MKALFLMAAAVLTAAEPDPRLFALLTEDVQSVTGIDWERFSSSRLANRFPLSLGDILGDNAATAKVTQFVTIGITDLPPLFVLFGEFGPIPAPAEGETQRHAAPERGVLFVGAPSVIASAVTAWRNPSTKPPAWAARLRELGRDYDNWAFHRSPLKGTAPAPRPAWDELRRSLLDVSLGARFGGRIECYASVTMSNFDDATTAAALARWLPAFAESRRMEEADLVPLIEGYTARQDGNRVEIRFAIENEKLRQR